MSVAMPDRWVLGRYRIVRRLAQGGMGVVYLGRLEGAAGFAKPVIIKRIIPDAENLEESTARFIREAQILSHLQHPGIVSVLDFGQEQDGYAMVLEYMHGYDLQRWLKYLQLASLQLPWEEAVLVLLRVLDGLHYAHTFRQGDGTAAGVLHRDISPGNILLDIDGQVRLLDFGIARKVEEDPAAQYKTGEGLLRGKVGYLAPELFAASPPSTSSDVYACGIVLHQMLTGAHPFAGGNERQTVWRVMSEMPKPISAARSDVPQALEAALLRCLAKEPEERHESAEAFAHALRRLLTRSEADLHSDLRQRLRRDFTGALPGLLQIEPLGERERAWKISGGPAEEVPALLRSSRAPPSHATPASAELHGLEATLASHGIAGKGPSAEPEHVRHAGSPLRTRQRRMIAGFVLGVGLAGVLGGSLFSRHGGPAPAAGRFIVVESPPAFGPRGEPQIAAAPPADLRLSTDSPGGTLRAAARSSDENDSTTSDADRDRNRIARQLARRHAALQACVQPFSAAPTAELQISISLEIAASGRVTRAALVPDTLEGTPAGKCLLEVARETQFQELQSPVQISVPLRARAVSR